MPASTSSLGSTLVIAWTTRKSVTVTSPPTDPWWLPWAMRLSWLSLPFTTGAVLADALDDHSTAVQVTAALLAWTAWTIVVLGLLVRRPAALTLLRIVAPLAFIWCLVAAVDAGRGAFGLALTGVTVVIAFIPETGAWLVNGAAYGYERRYPLRAPGAVLAGPIELSWLFLATAVSAGPMLLAARQWVVGGAALVIGVPVAVLMARALHALSMRWVVLVPAGLVLKDHVTIVDPVLFQRADIESLQPASADTEALDLTARSPGVAVELRLREPATFALVRPRTQPTTVHTLSLFFTPTRPGALLADAGTRRIRIH